MREEGISERWTTIPDHSARFPLLTQQIILTDDILAMAGNLSIILSMIEIADGIEASEIR